MTWLQDSLRTLRNTRAMNLEKHSLQLVRRHNKIQTYQKFRRIQQTDPCIRNRRECNVSGSGYRA